MEYNNVGNIKFYLYKKKFNFIIIYLVIII